MHFLQREIGIPQISIENTSPNTAILTVEPLPAGYGVTLGNTLRRVLLSSIPGAAVTSVKIKGVAHEYSTIPHIKESVLDILLNLKQLRFKKHNLEPEVIRLEVKKEGKILASDIKTSSNLEILNPDLVIATSDSSSQAILMDITVEKGVGYLTVSGRKNNPLETDTILVDAVFSPVRLVEYHLESARVGQTTNLDKLVLSIETDGSISPQEAVQFSSNLLQSYFLIFNEQGAIVEPEFLSDAKQIRTDHDDTDEPVKENYTPIEILNFSPRTLNALINGGIGSIEQLVKCTPAKLSNFRGFGKKAMDEVAAALGTRSLALSEEDEDSPKKKAA